ncbi:hypothetical protein COCSUDRAFT_32175 [Coccomyxa subellipsoidea C-169]|uniref:BZIP domain-containing protein n=1 Tax=Coccomyxa subellipsoidea (strain C-169) TaxID=574566 RepID=I0Z752_COCSC|nr:hypothetical protein COCSUDRAFT_32175 [Coccomyxa subellipsoidea C-169]EIE26471.1 hypothetical protein COCSUDRAFT_32175 [Coccomyxa subellipsoidea C-169]|eukprot:XP_005651015.1 hypothetical protein COCSUDRAFT_32175 [Coccomyxa subellipsoidea C-169]
MMQQQQQQRSNPGDWAPFLAALAGADPQQIAPILAAILPKPNGGAAAAGQDAEGRAGIAGLRAAAQAQGGEGSAEGAPAFTELAGRVFPGKPEGDAAASASAPKEAMQIDTASLLPLLQLTQPHLSLGGDAGHQSAGDSGQAGLSQAGGGVAKCAKEKNRAAQRRFRERQKGLISALKEREETLSKQCEEQKRLIETMQKEIQVLKEIIHSKDPK